MVSALVTAWRESRSHSFSMSGVQQRTGDKELLEQQPELHARVVAHEHGPAHHHEEEGIEMGPDPALLQIGQQEELFQSQQHEIV